MKNFPQWDGWVNTTPIVGKNFGMVTMSHSSVK